jgi:hypothetical protein
MHSSSYLYSRKYSFSILPPTLNPSPSVILKKLFPRQICSKKWIFLIFLSHAADFNEFWWGKIYHFFGQRRSFELKEKFVKLSELFTWDFPRKISPAGGRERNLRFQRS